MLKEEKLKLYEKIANEIKEQYNVEISIQEIDSVVQSQFKIMAYGFSKGITTHIIYVGKFIPFDMDYYAEKFIIPNKKLQESLVAEGKEDAAKEAFVASYRRYKQVISEKNNELMISAEELVNIPYIDGSSDNFDIFKSFR